MKTVAVIVTQTIYGQTDDFVTNVPKNKLGSFLKELSDFAIANDAIVTVSMNPTVKFLGPARKTKKKRGKK